jgi:ubiquitin-protein ligase
LSRYWWGTENEVSPRLRLEVELMQATFQDTFRLERDRDYLFWLGRCQVNMTGIQQREHVLKIIYPKDYPNIPPESYCLSPKIYSPKHQFEDGQLCLFNPKDGIGYGWNPSTSTAITVAAWSIEWLYAFYTWRATGEWPGKEERIQPTKKTNSGGFFGGRR